MADVFISYHTESAGKLVRKIADELESVGISCWYAKRDVKAGQFVKSIMNAINQCKIFLLILNEEANQSKYVFNELSNAYRRFEDGIIILPFKVGNFQVSDNVQFFLTTLHTINGGDSMESVCTEELIQKVAESLRITPKIAESPSKSSTPPDPTPQPTPKPDKFKVIKRIFIPLATALGLLLLSILFLRSYHPTWSVYKIRNLDGDVTLTISGAGEMDYGSTLSRLLLYGKLLPMDYPPWYPHGATVADVKIDFGVTNIKTYAFCNFSRLKTVTIPDSVTYIGKWAFSDCSRLKDVTISKNVTAIENGAFQKCTSLLSVEIPNSVTEIGGAVFYGCINLPNVHIPESVTEIGDSAFERCTSLKSVEIPDSVTKIGKYAFADCTNLTEASVPDGLDITNVFPEHTQITYR